MSENPFRRLPAVNQVLEHPLVQGLEGSHAHDVILGVTREELDRLRERIKAGELFDDSMSLEETAQRIVAKVNQQASPMLRQVINATGIVLHTNLGRSPIAEEAARAAYEAAHGYLNLELELATGKRSSRQNPLRGILSKLTGAESATAVNNCAAATVIVLRALAMGKEVVVSRGQLIEIGGSFRIPEIMGVSGATLREVGTTNITRAADYERAIGPNTGLLMRVHCSNYRVRGFTKEVTLPELVELGKKHNIPVIDDVGSGAMIDFARFGLPGDPVVPESIEAGADLVLFSGDKLLGGPQAGVIVGKKPLIQRIEKDPLMRAFRLDKMTLAALEATLLLYLHPEKAIVTIPTLRMMNTTREGLRVHSESFAERLRTLPGIASAEVSETTAYVGGGSLPDLPLPTVVIAVSSINHGPNALAERLRAGTPAVMARIQDDRVMLDLRTVLPGQEEVLLKVLGEANYL